MNRIGLVDVDGHHFPNLALMKISAWHKAQGDNVEFATPLERYDLVYKSKVFTFTPDDEFCYQADEIRKGGTGYKDYKTVLPPEIEHICPDYSLYGNKDVAYGFTTRGCIRHCSFCLVHDKEGMIRANADIEEFLDGRKKLVLMDNNIVAIDHGIRQLEKCKAEGIAVDCNQGIDARIVSKSPYLMDLLANLPIYGGTGLRFACDDKSEIEPCKKAIDTILQINPKATFTVFCLLTSDQEDSINRVMMWRDYGHKVYLYAPPYRDYTDRKQEIPRWQKDLARWANNKFLYYSCDFEEYKKKDSKYAKDESLFT